mgnify:FL=1
MNNANDSIEKPQSDVYVELSAPGQNQLQQGIIFSKGNYQKQDCEVAYEANEIILDAGIYSFDLFYEPDITVDDATDNQQTIERSTNNKILLKLKKPKV